MADHWSYPPSLALAQLPTPLQPLDRYTAVLRQQNSQAPRLWVKRDDLTGCVESGNKIRKLEFLLADAQAQQASVVITCGGIQSNHCRATAILSARLGLKCHLILRGELPGEQTASGNLLLNEFCGATCSLYRKAYFQQNIEQLFAEWAEHYQSQGETVYAIPTGGSNGCGVWGYIRAVEELKADFEKNDIRGKVALLTAAGSGGTQAGLLAGCELHQLDARVYGINVCDNENWFVEKIRQDLQQWADRYTDLCDDKTFFEVVAKNATPRVIDGYVGQGYAKADKNVFDCIRNLARLEGIMLDPVYTGKAMYGFSEEIVKGRFDDFANLVFIHTGGVFGLLADESRGQL